MKEENNLLQTYEIFLKLMYLSLIKEFYMQKEYDARGNVTEYIDGRKTKFVRKYTKTDLLSSEEVFTVKEDDNNYKSTPDASRSYAYDEGGILKQVSEGSKIITYNEKDGSYQSDAYGNIRSMKWSSTGLEMNYEYDNLNRMTSVITPDGKDVVYAYNQNNQVTKFGDVSITYSKARISEYTLLNGIKKSFEYNDLGVTSSLKYNKNDGDTSISTGFSYTYDDNFNIKTRTSLDTEKLSSFEYDDANRLTNSNMSGEFQSKEPEQLTINNFSYINRDLVGAKQELVKYEVLPEIIFDTSARSYVYKFSGTKEIRAIELYPENKVHRVRERDVHIYVKGNTEDSWKEVRNWKFNKDEKNGKLSFVFKEAVSAGYVKVRSVWDDRNKENVCIDDYSTFKGKPNNLLRIWTLENTLAEEYSYDGNSNRIRKAENGSGFSYEYYKNTQGGNTAKVKFDGKWYYTYDANGNRTSRAKALISGEPDKNKEYWTYEWDLWNRLVKVVQYNAPDNGECVEVSYEYDVFNHRIKRTSYDEDNKEREVTKYAYGRNGALAYQEKTVDGNVTKRSFTYLNNEIVGFTDKTNAEEEKLFYTVTDIQGSITEVYDGSSKLVWKSGYTAFGEIAGETVDLIDFDGMYTGCDYDAETGLTYHWNRWRNEDGSAFISEDPARDGANWYGYAGQNPMVYVDRIGLAPSNDYLGPGVAGPQPKPQNQENGFVPLVQNPSGMPQNQTPNITGQGGNQTVIPEVETDFISEIWDYVPSLLDLKDGWKKAVVSVFVTYIDNQLDKAMQREINGEYKGSLYFQQYITQVEAHNEADGLMTILSFVPEPSFSGALTIAGFLHNFEKRDGRLIHENITGFIKGAEQEIVRIDKLLGSSDNQEFKDFLHTQKDYLDKEINLNRNQYFSNIVYSSISGRQIDIDKNEEIESSVPLPGIKYKERFLQGGTN